MSSSKSRWNRVCVERTILFTLATIFMMSTLFVEDCASADTKILLEAKTYIYKNKIDLQGKTICFAKGCIINFNGGTLYNGKIEFDSTAILGHPHFENCIFSGSIVIDKIDDRDFKSQDDTGTFKFLFNNAVNNGIRCDFYRSYNINMGKIEGEPAFMTFDSIDSGADIFFHGNKLSNIYSFKIPTIKAIILLRNAKNISIHNLFFHDADAHNCHYFKKSAGCTFIQCYGDCEAINLLDCRQENGDCILRSGVWVHNQKYPEDTPSRGLIKSKLHVSSLNTGYGLALYCGDSLDIKIKAENTHRGFYCTGMSNSNIVYNGYNPKETKTHILIKDAVYKKKDINGIDTIDMKGCNNLKIYAQIDELLPNEKIITFQSYGSGRKEKADFCFRSGKCHHHDIDFSAKIKKFPNKGYYIISNFLPDSGALDDEDMYGCKVTGLMIHDIGNIGGSANRYMCNIESYTDVDIKIKDCAKSSKEYGYDLQLVGNCRGNINVSNGKCPNVLVRKKTTGRFNINAQFDSKFIGTVNYINDGSSKDLVTITH